MDTQTRDKFAQGQIFIVATPIGNLKDMTFRAIETLQQADLIAAEDTRTSRVLLQHYGIDTPMIACHEHNERQATDRIIELLNEGKNIALISDAGTPAINDPGYRLLQRLRKEHIRITPIPGACSPITALCASGISSENFTYLGFFPRKGQAKSEILQRIADTSHTLIFLESPKRIVKTLNTLRTTTADRAICIARELTKLHEEFLHGSADELLEHFSNHTPRGEMVLIIDQQTKTANAVNDEEILNLAKQVEYAELNPSNKAKILAKKLGTSRNRIYNLLLNNKD